MPEPLSITCPNCGSGLKIKDYSLIGKFAFRAKVPCPNCKVPFQIAIHLKAAPAEVPAEPDEADLWAETRLWRCPWCSNVSQVPANEPDPSSCDECRANAPRLEPTNDKRIAVSKAQSPKKEDLSRQNTLVIGFGSFVLLFFACCLLPTGGRNGSTSSSRSSSFPSVGDHVVITVEMWLSVDEAAREESQKLAHAKDEIGLEQMELRGRIFVVPAGTEGLLLEGGLFTSRVRILSGKHRGKAGYISSDFVK